MGMYDTIQLTCIFCEKETESQTKLLGSDMLQIIQVGDNVTEEFGDCIFQLKSDCSNCENPLKIIIEKGIFKEVTKDEPNIIEDIFSQYQDLRKERREK